MSETAVLERIDTLTRTVERLVERIEDLEDNRDLEQAISENEGKPLVAWDKAKALSIWTSMESSSASYASNSLTTRASGFSIRN